MSRWSWLRLSCVCQFGVRPVYLPYVLQSLSCRAGGRLHKACSQRSEPKGGDSSMPACDQQCMLDVPQLPPVLPHESLCLFAHSCLGPAAQAVAGTQVLLRRVSASARSQRECRPGAASAGERNPIEPLVAASRAVWLQPSDCLFHPLHASMVQGVLQHQQNFCTYIMDQWHAEIEPVHHVSSPRWSALDPTSLVPNVGPASPATSPAQVPYVAMPPPLATVFAYGRATDHLLI